jgi:hypothetical protein
MVTDFDERGKVFTQIITKRPVLVTLQTTSQLIKGNIHIRPNERIKDELNQDENFIAVTNATIIDNQGQIFLRCSFLTVNVSQIIWLVPDNELEQ